MEGGLRSPLLFAQKRSIEQNVPILAFDSEGVRDTPLGMTHRHRVPGHSV